MLYSLLRPITGIALRWFYSRIDVDGLERVPPDAPVLLAVNHPNALVDALVVGWMLPRRIAMTAKATLFANPLLAALFRAVGVVPLIRAKDLAGQPADPARNARSFAALNAALARGRAVLIFPEGITGDHPALAPLRTGAARIALQARDAGLRGVRIVPIGLTFERKDAPRSRVFVQIGEPIDVDAFAGTRSDAGATGLTAEIEQRLRAVTLNFESADDAARATALASSFARLLRGARETPQVYRPVVPLADQVAIARRLEALRVRLADAPEAVRTRVDELLRRLERFRAELAERDLAIEDVEIARDARSGGVFVLRELPVLLLAGPFAVWGWLNHWLPFNLSQAVARRGIESNADPAMRAIVGGLALVLLFYAVQAALVVAVFGWLPAAVYVVSLPTAADVNFHLRARLGRARRRARAYFAFRRDPGLQARLAGELRWLRDEALRVDTMVSGEAEAPA